VTAAPSFVPLAPSVVVSGFEHPLIHPTIIPREGRVDLLALSGTSDDEPVATFLLEPPFAHGEHDILDLWDGVSGLRSVSMDDELQLLWEIEDQDADGVADFWWGSWLLPGPLMGRVHDPLDAGTALAHLAVNDQGGAMDGEVLAAGFDADGDGHTDVVTGNGLGQERYYVHYGPFAGEIPSRRNGDNLQATELGFAGCNGLVGFRFLPDAFGPGQPGFSTGNRDAIGGCSGSDWQIFSLQHARGTVDSEPVATFVGRHEVLAPLPDLTGDGVAEAAWFSPDAQSGWPQVGPLDGEEAVPAQQEVEVRHGYLTGSIGDVNGDGVDDMAGRWVADEGVVAVYLLSPHAVPVDLSTGLEVHEHLVHAHALRHGDLDGDGLDDVVFEPVGDAPDEVVFVYYGADLTEAWDAPRPR